MMGFLYRSFCLVFVVALAGCLAPGTHTAAPPGAGPSDVASSIDSPIVVPEETGSKDGPPDTTSNQPGPGGSMPSGDGAPPPLVPVQFSYAAVGHYCRVEGNNSKAMVWGRLYRKEGAGQSDDANWVECTSYCQNQDLRLVSLYGGEEAIYTISLEDAPDFSFYVDMDDPKKFSLGLTFQKVVAIIGQETQWTPTQAFVLKEFKPYMEEGVVSACPSTLMRRATTARPGFLAPSPTNTFMTQP